MNSSLRIQLHTTAEQQAKLAELQRVFAQVCNALAPLVQESSCWNRVALHHMAYKRLRQQYPGLGSQMVCNAIYSVSRACRAVYQHPQSPFNLQRLAGKPLPLVRFLPSSPVYFDRHTLSLKDGMASMYTLDGRMRFNLPLHPADEQRFRDHKLREIVLAEQDGLYALNFTFDEGEAVDQAPMGASHAAMAMAAAGDLPEYVLVCDADDRETGLSLTPPATQATAQPTHPHP